MSMQAMLAASQTMSRMQTMQSARTQLQGTAKVLRIESKQDGGNEMKDAKATELDEKSNNLMGDLMEEMNGLDETIKADEKAQAEEKLKEKMSEEDAEKKKRADSVTLSDIAAGYRGPWPTIHPVLGEPVTYKPDGSTVSEAPVQSTPVFETTA